MRSDFGQVRREYLTLLLDGIVPFWFRNGIDWEHGGVLSCMNEEGTIVSTDKYLWSQARSVWTFSALYNRIEQRTDFLRAAENSVRFLLAHGRDAQGRFVYHTTREGQVVEGPISIFSDCFVIYGLSEYYRAVRDYRLLDIARETLSQVMTRIAQPDFADVAPQKLPPGRRAHVLPMILLEISNELAQTIEDLGSVALDGLTDGLTYILTARYLGPVEYGQYLSILVFLNLVDIVNLSIEGIHQKRKTGQVWSRPRTPMRRRF